MRRAASLAAVVAALLCPAPALAGGLQLTGARAIDARLRELTLRSSALASPTKVRILLPSGYGRTQRRYPVLYLLHGGVDDQNSWTVKGHAEAITAGARMIVVMPDSGLSGGYTDWYNDGRGGSPAWETYHIDQLLPWVDAHYRTTATRGGRAIAGLSMGGFGAMSYAARHPDLFAAAAVFSGAVDTNNPGDVAFTPDTTFGPRATEEVRWRGHNPTDLAANLRGLNLTLRTGNGEPGGPFGGGDVVETVVHQMNLVFHVRLARLAIRHVWDDYGPGGHLWPYWDRDLRETLPTLERTFANPPAPPARVSFSAIEPDYTVFGWHVRLRREQLEFSTLSHADRTGFAVAGSGTATVTTPALYPPRGRLTATIGTLGAGRRRALRADRRGRITVTVRLGPSNTAQQYTPGTTTTVHVVRVRLG